LNQPKFLFLRTNYENIYFIDLDNTNGDQIALDRQLKVFKETGSLIEVVKYIESSFLQTD
jgi:hypothetical protein